MNLIYLKTCYRSINIDRISKDTPFKLLSDTFNYFTVILNLKLVVSKNLFKFLNSLVSNNTRQAKNFFNYQIVILKNFLICKKFIVCLVQESDF